MDKDQNLKKEGKLNKTEEKINKNLNILVNIDRIANLNRNDENINEMLFRIEEKIG